MPSHSIGCRSIGLYVHVPFCRAKCGYCSFYSVEPATGQVDDYLSSLGTEMDLRARDPGLQGRSFATVYVGGGTPSVISPGALKALLNRAFEKFHISSDSEVTIEANPESVGWELASIVAGLPGGRVSLGVQSFCSDVLSTLGRIHGPNLAAKAFQTLRDAGVGTISLDLIYGTPGETLECWLRTLDAALALKPDHISAYCLSIDEGTPLAQRVVEGMLPGPDESLQRDMYTAAVDRMKGRGFEHYEISNFARSGSRSLHNQIYWRRGEYLGLGPSAHSFLGRQRWWNYRDVERYCGALREGLAPTASRESISHRQALEETVMLALRTSDGLDLDDLRDRWGPELCREILGRASQLAREDFVAIDGGRLRISPSAYFVSDDVIARLLHGPSGVVNAVD